MPIEDHHVNLLALKDEIIDMYVRTFVIFCIVGLPLKFVVDFVYQMRANSKGKSSSTNIYLAMSTQQRFYYTSYLISTVYSIELVYFTLKTMLDCNPPADKADEIKWLMSDTMITNMYCRTTMNNSQILINIHMVAIMSFDLLYQIILVRDFKSGAAI